jgi:superfamily I DNA and RNA helicase
MSKITTQEAAQGLQDVLVKAIEKGLEECVNEEFERGKKVILERIDRAKGEIVAGILVQLMKTTDMQISQDRIIFTIQTGKLTP